MRTKHSSTRAGAVAMIAAAGLLVAGCGGDDEEEESAATPEEAVSTFFETTVDQDAAGICGVISADSQAQVVEDEGADSCEDAISASLEAEDAQATLDQLDGAEVGESTIDGETATVTVTSSEGEEGEVSLVQEDGWKVDTT